MLAPLVLVSLQHKFKWKELVIAYNGCGLNKAEQNYSTTERDAPAPVEGIKKFQPYLHNGKFTVVTDHSLLRWLMKVQNASGRLAKMGLSLATV